MAEVEDKLKDYEIKKEGEAEILLHKNNAVFYNPVQCGKGGRWWKEAGVAYSVAKEADGGRKQETSGGGRAVRMNKIERKHRHVAIARLSSRDQAPSTQKLQHCHWKHKLKYKAEPVGNFQGLPYVEAIEDPCPHLVPSPRIHSESAPGNFQSICQPPSSGDIDKIGDVDELCGGSGHMDRLSIERNRDPHTLASRGVEIEGPPQEQHDFIPSICFVGFDMNQDCDQDSCISNPVAQHKSSGDCGKNGYVDEPCSGSSNRDHPSTIKVDRGGYNVWDVE